MKVIRDKEFQPITIILETEIELAEFYLKLTYGSNDELQTCNKIMSRIMNMDFSSVNAKKILGINK